MADIFKECKRIADSISLDDLLHNQKCYVEAFKVNLNFMANDFDNIDLESRIFRTQHIMDHIQFITENMYEDEDNSNRRKFLQIYFLIRTKLL